jgi:hypothetical protein
MSALPPPGAFVNAALPAAPGRRSYFIAGAVVTIDQSDHRVDPFLPPRNLESSAWGAGAASAPPARANARGPK